MMGTITVLVGCQDESCAETCSHRLDDLRKFNGEPICELCYDEEYKTADDPEFDALPFIKLEDLDLPKGVDNG
ncbi:MAG: hypothetical protein V7727_21955 [Sneathiella sp.]